MCESEWDGAEAVEHPKHGQARPYGVSGLDADQAGDAIVCVSLHQTWNRNKTEFFWSQSKLMRSPYEPGFPG